MKTLPFAIVLVFLSINTGCKMNPEKKETPLPVFDLGEAITKHVPDTFTWNSITKHITYIPISSTSDLLFASAQPVYSGKDFYCVVDHRTSTIFCTDKNGKVIHSFSKKGQGPGEYTMITYVHVNPQESTIRVFDQRANKYIVYDLDGNMKQEIFLKDKEITTPLFISNNYTVAKGQNDAPYRLYITDKELNIREGMFPADTSLTEMERMCMTWQLNFCRNRDQAIVHYVNEDTVFTVNGTGLQPLCIFKKGEYKLPEEEAKKPMEMTTNGSPYIRSMWLSSVPGYYLIAYLRENHFFYEVWDQTNNEIISRFSNEKGEWGLPLCLPSGKKVRIDTRNIYINGNTVISYIDAATAAEGKVPGVNEDDNPVLVVMEL